MEIRLRVVDLEFDRLVVVFLTEIFDMGVRGRTVFGICANFRIYCCVVE